MLEYLITEYLSSFCAENWPAAALALVPAGVSAWLILMTLRRVPASEAGGRYLFFTLSMLVWQLSECLMRLTASEEIAAMLNRYVAGGGTFLAAAGLDLALVLTERQRLYQSRMLRLAIYLPSVVYTLLFAHGLGGSSLMRDDFWGWTSVPGAGLMTSLFTYWFSALGLASLACYGLYALEVRQRDMLRKARAGWLLAGYLVPVCQGVFTEVIMPYGFGVQAIPITSTFMMVFSLASYLVILRYGLLAFTPDLLRGQLAGHISEGVVIVDNDETFQFGNNRFFGMTGYSRNELVGTNFLTFLDAEGERAVLSKKPLRQKGIADSYDIRLKTRTGDWLDVLVSAAPFYDGNGKIIGSIAILTDITERRRTEIMLSNALIEGQEFERRRIAQDLHDGFGQLLAAISMHVQALKIRDESKTTADKLLGLIKSAVLEYRAITHNLLPPALEKSGIRTALEELCESGSSDQVGIMFRPAGDFADVARPVQAELYRIAQELIANAVKHGRPSAVKVRLAYDGREILMEVADDGAGFDAGENRGPGGIGIRNVAARVSLLRGDMKLQSAPGKGTSVIIRIPSPGLHPDVNAA